MKTSVFLCAGVTCVVLHAGGAAAGEPVFGSPTVYGRLNLTLEHAATSSAAIGVRQDF